jgi:hypothetical protein
VSSRLFFFGEIKIVWYTIALTSLLFGEGIDNYEQFQKKLIEVVQPSILSGLESEREEFREIIKNTLFDLDGPRHFASSLTRRDEVFASQLFLDFNEIVASYLSLKDIEIYINRFPYRDTGVSALRYLKYHIESHLNEIYIFKERFEAYLTFVERRYRKSPISENVSSTAQGLKKIILSSLDGIITIRGAHVHSKRFSDQDLDRLTFLEMLKDSEGAKDPFVMAYELEYKDLQKKWAKRIRENNDAVKKLLDICCKGLYSVLFDKQGKLVFPDTSRIGKI